MFHSTSLGCGCCGNGLVAFVLTADGRRLVLFCLNCGTWYPSVNHDAVGELQDCTAPEGSELILPEAGCSIRFPPARWATVEEVRAYGWGDYLDQRYPGHNWSPEEREWWPERIRGIA
jgi:hypothetical protein